MKGNLRYFVLVLSVIFLFASNFVVAQTTATITDNGDAMYVFNTDEGIASLGIEKPAQTKSTDLASTPYVVGPISMTAAYVSGSSHPRILYNTNGELSFRLFTSSSSSVTFEAAEGYTISGITFTGPSGNNINNYLVPESGSLTSLNWTPDGDNVKSIKFTATTTGDSKTVIINTITVHYSSSIIASVVSDFAELKKLDNNTLCFLNLPESNAAIIQYVNPANAARTINEQDAYIRDNTGAVKFKNFLSEDRAWHTKASGALIGKILGKYIVENGMPTFVSAYPLSTAHQMLCLDNYAAISPTLLTVANLAGSDYRADYVKIQEGTLAIEDGKYYLTEDSKKVLVSDLFGLGIELPSYVTGSRFNLTGIVGTDTESTSVLYLLTLEKATTTLALDESKANSTALAANEGESVNITMKRQLTQGMWNTICLPFDIASVVDELGNAHVAAFTGYNSLSNTLEFETVTNIEAGKPYLIFPDDEISNVISMTGVTISTTLIPVTYGTYSFVPVFDPTTLTAGDTSTLFLGAENTLYYPSTTADMLAFRAYFKVSGGSLAPAQVSIDGTTTGITALDLNQSAGSDKFYDISGRYIGTQDDLFQRGVYVKQGAKVIIK